MRDSQMSATDKTICWRKRTLWIKLNCCIVYQLRWQQQKQQVLDIMQLQFSGGVTEYMDQRNWVRSLSNGGCCRADDFTLVGPRYNKSRVVYNLL